MPSERIVYVAPDALEMAFGFLGSYLPGSVTLLSSVPEEYDWDQGGTVVQLGLVSGPGEPLPFLESWVVTAEVIDRDSTVSARVANLVASLLASWQYGTEGVYWRRTVQSPSLQMDDELNLPFYSLSVQLAFRASEETLRPTTMED